MYHGLRIDERGYVLCRVHLARRKVRIRTMDAGAWTSLPIGEEPPLPLRHGGLGPRSRDTILMRRRAFPPVLTRDSLVIAQRKGTSPLFSYAPFDPTSAERSDSR